jgi:hypothetical protein
MPEPALPDAGGCARTGDVARWWRNVLRTLREYRGKEGQDPSVGKNTSFGLNLTGSDDRKNSS